jgi:biliverdin reductase
MQPVRVGLVGTGYAAKLRAQALVADRRSQLVAIAGRDADRVATLVAGLELDAGSDAIQCDADWRLMVESRAIDLLVVATVNGDHGAIVRAGLEAGIPVAVEYPLALSYAEGRSLLDLARSRGLMLHVEHIERLGGLHQALLRELPRVGQVRSVRYATVNPQRPAPAKWTYSRSAFGFPFVGALSRVQRLTHAFGPVAAVTGQAQFWDGERLLDGMEAVGDDRFTACLCEAQLEFCSGVRGNLLYGKGDCFWRSERCFEVTGQDGMLRFEGEQGVYLGPDGEEALAVGGRRGLFVRDTTNLLDHLLDGSPLYIEVEESLYALAVAETIGQAAQSGDRVRPESDAFGLSHLACPGE